MAFERKGVGDFDAAQPDMVAGGEAMHVEALPRAHVGLGCAGALGHGQVLRGRQLAVGLAPLHQGHRQPRQFGDGCVVGEVQVAGRRGGLVRGQNLGKTKGLRCLRAPQAVPGHGLDDALLRPRPLQRVRHRHGGDCARCLGQCVEHTVDDVGGDEGADGIVNDDRGWAERGQGAQPIQHGALPRIPAGRRCGKLGMTAADRAVVERLVAGPDHDQDMIDAGMTGEQGQGAR